jgi:hypothetical protein
VSSLFGLGGIGGGREGQRRAVHAAVGMSSDLAVGVIEVGFPAPPLKSRLIKRRSSLPGRRPACRNPGLYFGRQGLGTFSLLFSLKVLQPHLVWSSFR